MERILSINEHYIKNLDEEELYKNLKIYAEKYKKKIDDKYEKSLIKSIHFLKNKAKKLEDIYQNAQYIIKEDMTISDQDSNLLDKMSKKIIRDFLNNYEKVDKINKENLEKIIKNLISENNINFKDVGQPLRIVLTGSKFGPGIYDIILSLNKNEVIRRLKIIN